MVTNLIHHYGVLGTYPDLQTFCLADEDQLRQKIRMGYRAKYFKKIVETLLAGYNEDKVDGSLPGLGKYGASHLKMLSGDYSTIPIDSEVRSFCKEHYGLTTDIDINDHFDSWGKFKYLGYKIKRIIERSNWIG